MNRCWQRQKANILIVSNVGQICCHLRSSIGVVLDVDYCGAVRTNILSSLAGGRFTFLVSAFAGFVRPLGASSVAIPSLAARTTGGKPAHKLGIRFLLDMFFPLHEFFLCLECEFLGFFIDLVSFLQMLSQSISGRQFGAVRVDRTCQCVLKHK